MFLFQWRLSRNLYGICAKILGETQIGFFLSVVTPCKNEANLRPEVFTDVIAAPGVRSPAPG